MKYVFGFNVGVKLYKKFPTLRIHADDRLIDEFELNEADLFKETYVFDRKTFPSGPEGTASWHLDRFYSKKIRVYKIGEKYLNNKITIDIKNQDNNYTNGFMTRSTLIRFSNIFLMPEELYVNLTDLIAKIKDLDDVKKSHNLKMTNNSVVITHWPSTRRTQMVGDIGGNHIINLPIFHLIKYKHLNEIYDQSYNYCSANDIGYQKNSQKNQYVGFAFKFLKSLNKCINK